MAVPSVTHLKQQVTLPIGAGDPHNVIATIEVLDTITVTDGWLSVRRVADSPVVIVKVQQNDISAPHTIAGGTQKFDLTFPLTVAHTEAIGREFRDFDVEPHAASGALGTGIAGRIRCAIQDVTR